MFNLILLPPRYSIKNTIFKRLKSLDSRISYPAYKKMQVSTGICMYANKEKINSMISYLETQSCLFYYSPIWTVLEASTKQFSVDHIRIDRLHTENFGHDSVNACHVNSNPSRGTP